MDHFENHQERKKNKNNLDLEIFLFTWNRLLDISN